MTKDEIRETAQLKKKVLIVDDDYEILNVMRLILEQVNNYEVDICARGEELFDLSEDLPDVILLDLAMSGVDGRDICKYLKSQQETKHLPIIIVSANPNIAKIANAASADDFLSKPFDMSELLKKVASQLNK